MLFLFLLHLSLISMLATMLVYEYSFVTKSLEGVKCSNRGLAPVPLVDALIEFNIRNRLKFFKYTF